MTYPWNHPRWHEAYQLDMEGKGWSPHYPKVYIRSSYRLLQKKPEVWTMPSLPQRNPVIGMRLRKMQLWYLNTHQKRFARHRQCESRESDNSSVSTNSPQNELILLESDSDSPISPTSSHQQSEEQLPTRTVNDVLRQPPTNPTLHPKNAKLQFYHLLREHQVCNAKHYDTLLTTNAYLRKIEESLNPNLLQTCKRVAFNQNLLFDKPSYIDPIKDFTPLDRRKRSSIDERSDWKRCTCA